MSSYIDKLKDYDLRDHKVARVAAADVTAQTELDLVEKLDVSMLLAYRMTLITLYVIFLIPAVVLAAPTYAAMSCKCMLPRGAKVVVLRRNVCVLLAVRSPALLPRFEHNLIARLAE